MTVTEGPAPWAGSISRAPSSVGAGGLAISSEGNSTTPSGGPVDSWPVDPELKVWSVAMDSLLRVLDSKSLGFREEPGLPSDSFESFELFASLFCLGSLSFFDPWNMPLGKSATAKAMSLMSVTSDAVTAEMGSHGSPSVIYSFGRHLECVSTVQEPSPQIDSSSTYIFRSEYVRTSRLTSTVAANALRQIFVRRTLQTAAREGISEHRSD